MNADSNMVAADMENRGYVDAYLYIENVEEGCCLYEESPELHDFLHKKDSSKGVLTAVKKGLRNKSVRNVF